MLVNHNKITSMDSIPKKLQTKTLDKKFKLFLLLALNLKSGFILILRLLLQIAARFF